LVIEIIEGINLGKNKIDGYVACFYLCSIWWSRKSGIEDLDSLNLNMFLICYLLSEICGMSQAVN